MDLAGQSEGELAGEMHKYGAVKASQGEWWVLMSG